MRRIIRMIETQVATAGESPTLEAARLAALSASDRVAAGLDSELAYRVVDIRNLVCVQAGSALPAASYAAER